MHGRDFVRQDQRVGDFLRREDKRRDLHVDGFCPGRGARLVEGSEEMTVRSEAQADLFLGLPDRGVDEALVVGLGATAGQADMARPRIVRMIGPLDEQCLQSVAARTKQQSHRGGVGGAVDHPRFASAQRVRDAIE